MGILPANLPVNDDEGDDDDLGSRDDEDEDEDDYDDEDRGGDEDEGLFGGGRRVDLQRQFGDETARVLWVSHPALHPELNLHVWEAAGKAMPLIRSGAGPVPGDEGGLFGDGARVVSPPPPPPPPAAVEREEQMEVEVEAQTEGEVKKEEEQQQQLSSAHEVNAHPGAGTGVIGGAGSSLNHVVAVEWSPSGLGRNLRPVLAVLTGCGSLAVYGEGGPLPFGSTAKPSRVMGRGKSAVRDLQSWLVLWAVGENFVVPGQEEFGYGEFVKAFAWCQEVGTGRALLSYMNDLREIVILCVGTTFQRTAEGLEEAVWNVQEIFRMETGGPHGQPDVSICVNGEWGCKADIMYRLVIQTMFRLGQATASDGVPGSRKKTPGVVCCLIWTGTTSGSRKSLSMHLPGALERLPPSYASPKTGTVDVSTLAQTPSWSLKTR